MDDYNNQAGQSGQYQQGQSTGTGGTAARMKEEIAEQTAGIKDKVTDLGRRAADRIDNSREAAASALGRTASSLHTSGDKVSGAAHTAADKLQATAEYVRRTDLKGMAEDVQDLVKRYPGASLAAAAILGFIVARGMRGNDY